jgi:hypothetical protein
MRLTCYAAAYYKWQVDRASETGTGDAARAARTAHVFVLHSLFFQPKYDLVTVRMAVAILLDPYPIRRGDLPTEILDTHESCDCCVTAFRFSHASARAPKYLRALPAAAAAAAAT